LIFSKKSSCKLDAKIDIMRKSAMVY